jgi:hypothetical protein
VSPIERLQPGDAVAARGSSRPITRVLVHTDEPSVTVMLADGTSFSGAGRHRFELAGGDLVSADQLAVGTRLRAARGEEVEVVGIELRTRRLYRLQVEGDEPYHVGDAGITVHN